MTRRYTDKEVALIIRKALDGDGSGRGLVADDSDLTLEQIKEIAAEVGISPQRIERAAAVLAEPELAPVHPYAGIPTTVTYQATVPGKALAETPVEEVLAITRRLLGRQGIVHRDGDTVEWMARDPTGGRYVTLTSSAEGIRLSVLGNYRDGLLSALGAAGGATFVGAAAIISSLGFGPAGILLGAAAAAIIPPRFLYRWWRKREDATMATLTGRLLDILSRTHPDPSSDGHRD
jgi:hypothetical protein